MYKYACMYVCVCVCVCDIYLLDILSPCASNAGWARSLDLGKARRMFYYCATSKRHDTQHKDNNTQHKGLISDTQYKRLSIMLCHYVECHHAECRPSAYKLFTSVMYECS
jgi:hypothetical protein